MKKLLFAVLALFSTTQIFSQAEPVVFDSVIYVDGASKTELYLRARSFFFDEFKSANDVITIADSISGEIAGNGVFVYNPDYKGFGWACYAGYIRFKISIFVKDGRYKYVIENLTHIGSNYQGNSAISYGLITKDMNPPKPTRGNGSVHVWDDIYEAALKEGQGLINDIIKAMNTSHEKNNNW